MRLTPPMTTAAKALNSMPTPRLAVAPEVRMASSQPAMPEMAPARMKVMMTIRSTLMPARKVAVALPPIIVTCRPKGVLARMKVNMMKQATAIQAISGMPNRVWMPMTLIAGARSWAERPPEIATTRPRTQI